MSGGLTNGEHYKCEKLLELWWEFSRSCNGKNLCSKSKSKRHKAAHYLMKPMYGLRSIIQYYEYRNRGRRMGGNEYNVRYHRVEIEEHEYYDICEAMWAGLLKEDIAYEKLPGRGGESKYYIFLGGETVLTRKGKYYLKEGVRGWIKYWAIAVNTSWAGPALWAIIGVILSRLVSCFR